jgi:hypothetical protein
VEDNKDGTYTISLTAGPPCEIKVTVRIDGNDLPPYVLTVQKNPDQQEQEKTSKDAEGKDGDGKEGKDAELEAAQLPKDGPNAVEATGRVSPPPPPPVPWMRSPALQTLADEIVAEASLLDEQAASYHNTFEARLGSAILTKLKTVGTVQELVREWDQARAMPRTFRVA